MLTVYMTGEFTDDQLAQITAAAPGADVRRFTDRRELEAQIADAEVVAGNISADALARATRLKWVQSWAAGPDALTHAQLHEFLGAADFVVVTAPRTPMTEGMLGVAEFRAMKPTAYYICFSRGGIADDAALLQALQGGWIAGAGLDAHGEEPLPPDSPFWSLPNTLVTPHNGATTPATRQRGVDIFVENLRRYQAGEPLINLIDKHAGY